MLSPEAYHGPIQSPDHFKMANTTKSRRYSIFPRLCQLYLISLQIFWNYSSALHVYPPKGTPFLISLVKCHVHLLKHLKRLHHQLCSLPIGSQTLKSQSRLMLCYALTAVLSIMIPRMWTCTNGIPLPRHVSAQKLNYNVMTKATHNFWSFQWQHYLEGFLIPIDVVNWSPEFAILVQWQNPHMSTSTLVLNTFQIQPCNHFHPEKLRTNLGTYRWWMSILKRGILTMPASMPQNYHWYSLLSNCIILQPTTLSIPVLCGSLIMDTERLHADIQSQTSRGSPFLAETPDNQSDSQWTLIPMVYYATSDASMFPNSSQSPKHVFSPVLGMDHPLAGHFSQNKDPSSSSPHGILLVWTSSMSRTTEIMHHLFPHQTCAPQTLQLLKQLPILRALNHIHGFHRESSLHLLVTLNLVIVDHLSKQWTLHPNSWYHTSLQLAQLFVLHVFSKHAVPSHVTSDHSTELYPTSSGPQKWTQVMGGVQTNCLWW